nr:inositol monophosphatase family protein [Deinococcus yavapaiensis]
MEAVLETAVTAAKAAGSIHRQFAGRALHVRTKSSASDLVTEVDALAEAAIREVILARFPDHAILGEEEGAVGSSPARWVVDPLDGTVNYAHGFPVSCASVAFEWNGRRLAGAVYDQGRDELFTATLGGGAFLNGAPLAVSTTPSVSAPALLATGFPYDPEDTRNFERFRRLLAMGVPIRRPGAAALDLCYVAAGRLDGYWEFGLHPWDAAAGSLIVEEAGGRVTDGGGASTPYGEMILATNGLFHSELLGALA